MVDVAVIPLAKIEFIPEPLKEKLRTREREPGFDWEAIMATIATARGVKKSWCDFAFVVKNGLNYWKVLQGNYDESFSDGQAGAPVQSRQADAASRARGAQND
jgi:hypothetical protein